MVKAFNISITTQFFRADFFIFPVSGAPSNSGITRSTSSLVRNLSRSTSSMCLCKQLKRMRVLRYSYSHIDMKWLLKNN